MGLSKWFSGSQKDKDSHGSEGVLLCPRCNKRMLKKSRFGVTIDKCISCGGIWLDKGEIFNIIGKVKEIDGKVVRRGSKK